MVGNAISNSKQAEVGKRGWLKKWMIPLLTLLLVVAITVGLLFFSLRYPEKVEEFQSYGYLGAFLVSLVGNATIVLPIPGLLAVFFLGANPAFNPVWIGLAAGAGASIGEMTGYMLGYSGRGVVEKSRLYNRSMHWLKRWGSLTIFTFALTPLPDDVTGAVAGILRFPVWKFLLACFLGKALLSIGTAFAGAYGLEAVLRYLGG